MRRAKRDDEFIVVIVEIDVVAFFFEALNINYSDDLFGVGGPDEVGPNDNDVWEQRDSPRGPENERTIKIKRWPRWS